MKKLFLIIQFFIIFSVNAQSVDEGATLFKTYCSSCHALQGPPTLAPPISMVVNNLKYSFPAKKDFVSQVVNWVRNPMLSESVMPGAVRRFGLMPKLSYPEKDLTKIANYLYDGDFTSWMPQRGFMPRQHMQRNMPRQHMQMYNW